MQQLEQKQNRRKEDIKKLIDLVSMGELLPDVQTEWIDSFKADFTGNLTDLLLDISQQKEANLTLQDTVNLADAILIHDVLNENALRLKCSALVKMGKNGLAKTVYNSFINEYSASFGTPFKLSFEQAIV
jgi:two-component SAPR family response regulator